MEFVSLNRFWNYSALFEESGRLSQGLIILTKKYFRLSTLVLVIDSVTQSKEILYNVEFSPTSSTTTKDFSVACAKMKAVSNISDIKVD